MINTCFLVFYFALYIFTPHTALPDQEFQPQKAEIEKQINRQQPDSAIQSCNALLSKLQEESPLNYAQIATILFLRGRAQGVQGEGDMAEARRIIAAHTYLNSDTLVAQTHHYSGLYHAALHQHDSAEWHYQQAINLLTPAGEGFKRHLVASMNALGGLYAGLSDIQKSIDVRQRALIIAQSIPGDIILCLKLSNNLAMLYKNAEDFARSRLYFEQAELYTERLRDPFWQAMVDNNYGVFLAQFKYLKEARFYLERAGKYLEKSNNAPALYEYYQGWSIYYQNTGKPDSALIFNALQLESLYKNKIINPVLVAYTIYERSGCFELQERYDSCFSACEKSLAIFDTIFGPHYSMFRVGYRTQALCQIKMGNTDAGLVLLHRALLANNFKGIVDSLLYPMEGYRSFMEIGKCYYGKQDWQRALDYFQYADRALLLHRKRLLESDSKEKLGQNTRELCAFVMESCHQLYQNSPERKYIDIAFRLLEHTKSAGLLEDVRTLDANLKTGVDALLLTREDQIKRQIGNLEIQKNDIDKPLLERSKLSKQIIDHKKEYDRLVDTIKMLYPGYANLKYGQSSIELTEFEALCRKTGRVTINYFQGEKRIYAIIIHPKGVDFESIEVDSDTLNDVISAMRKLLAIPPTEPQRDNEIITYAIQYGQYGVRLYDWLFRPCKRYIADGSQVVIIPDGNIGYVPFETLLDTFPPSDKPLRFHTYPYSLLRHAFSYCYSASLLQNLESRYIAPQRTFLGVETIGKGGQRGDIFGFPFPFQKGNGEAKWLSEQISGAHLLDENATKAEFMAISSLFKVLHVVTHGHADSSDTGQSWLLISNQQDEKLRLWEIYTLRIKAAMVVLSACETGTGLLNPVEGVLSLGRGFIVAGAKSVVTTYWNIPDAESTVLMHSFYKNLFKHEEKDRALQNAKKAFLSEHTMRSAHPYYWSGYYITGDVNPLF
jgi:tetratricopeptide (TPR) repeat protein